MIASVGVLPWLDLEHPVAVGAITFYPLEAAVAILGERGDVLAERVGIFREKWDDRRVLPAIAIHADQFADGGDAQWPGLRRAADIFLTAAMFANDGGFQQTNATTFSLLVQKLGGGSGFISDTSRRRNGSVTDGGPATMEIHKPSYAGACSV